MTRRGCCCKGDPCSRCVDPDDTPLRFRITLSGGVNIVVGCCSDIPNTSSAEWTANPSPTLPLVHIVRQAAPCQWDNDHIDPTATGVWKFYDSVTDCSGVADEVNNVVGLQVVLTLYSATLIGLEVTYTTDTGNTASVFSGTKVVTDPCATTTVINNSNTVCDAPDATGRDWDTAYIGGLATVVPL
jgi:hypothetical protein